MLDSSSAVYLCLIPIVWCGLSWLLSRISGWHRLAAHYRCREVIAGESASLRSGRIGPVTYHSCLRFQVTDAGLGIRVARLFRVGHVPLFIPWDQFRHVKEDNLMYSHKVKASVGEPTITRVTLPGWVRYRMPMSLRPVDPRLSDGS
ncbi:MAG: hypothetical protein AAGG48_20360 [Planctomycetota bacterium]